MWLDPRRLSQTNKEQKVQVEVEVAARLWLWYCTNGPRVDGVLVCVVVVVVVVPACCVNFGLINWLVVVATIRQ